MAAPLVNPPMPLLTPIPGGFLHGKVIRIQGATSHSAQRFAINLQCGPNTNPRDDLALHFNVRMLERVIVRNSLIMGNWGQEERHCPTFPFLPGQGFEIVILADSHHYKIAINGHHFTEFHCRAPMERVSYLSADGEIMITTITFEGGSHHGHMPGPGHMPAPMPHNPSYGGGVAPYPPQVPHNPGYGGPAPYPAGMNPYPTQPGMPYPAAPGMAGYPAAGYTTGYGHLSPKSAPQYPDPQAYPSGPSGGSGKGLSGILGKAQSAVAGVLGPGAAGLLGGLAGGRLAGASSSGYPGAAYPGATYPGQHMGGPHMGGHTTHGGGSGGGLLGSLGGLGGVLGAATMGAAILNPKKAAKKQAKAQKKAMKYGLGAAGLGVGAYALHKGMKHGHHGYHGHGSSSSSSSSEEE